jgi:hypothetical protein
VPYIREDQADIRVSVNGVPYGDTWNTYEGGDLEADDAKGRAGGMGKQVSAGGPAARSDVTVGIELTDIVAGWHPALEAAVGGGKARVSLHFLGPDRLPNGQTHTVTGTLKAANLPTMGDGSDIANYQLVVSCDEQAA